MAKRDGQQRVLAVGDAIVTEAVRGVVVSAEAGEAMNGDPIVVKKAAAPPVVLDPVHASVARVEEAAEVWLEKSQAAPPAVGTDQAISDEAKMHAAELAETAGKVGKPKPPEDKAPPDKAPDPKPRNGTPGKKLEPVTCQRCRSSKTSVRRGTNYATQGVTRYRTCDGCGHRFTTFQPWIPGKEPGQNATEGKEDIVG